MTAAIVVGRNQFDIAQGWVGGHPLGVPVFVVTHETPEGWPRDDTPVLSFVHDGVAAAVDQASTGIGDGMIGVGPGQVTCEALSRGLVDELHIDLILVLLGEGVPMFADLAAVPSLRAHRPSSRATGLRTSATA